MDSVLLCCLVGLGVLAALGVMVLLFAYAMIRLSLYWQRKMDEKIIRDIYNRPPITHVVRRRTNGRIV